MAAWLHGKSVDFWRNDEMGVTMRAFTTSKVLLAGRTARFDRAT
jgi:hypothetical protein